MSTRHTRGVRRPLAVVKDLILFGLGTAIMYRQGWQVGREEFNWQAMVFGGVLTQAPGVMAWISLRRTAKRSSRRARRAPLRSPLPSLPTPSEDEA